MTHTNLNSDSSAGEISRRGFVAASALSSLASGVHANAAAVSRSPQDKVVVGVMGLSRGMSLAKTFTSLPNVEVKYLCETDSNRLKAAQKSFESLVDHDVVTTGDFKDILNDPDVDALVCAAPNHWHAPAAIMACNAGKHCYVEKPCSHNPWEGEMVVAAARKNKRCVQMGSQRRSGETVSYTHLTLPTKRIV